MLAAVGTLAGSLGIGAVVFVGVSFLELKRCELWNPALGCMPCTQGSLPVAASTQMHVILPSVSILELPLIVLCIIVALPQS